MLNPIAKWLHIIAGVMWIGLLYFFNFINGHVAVTMDGDSKKKIVPERMPRTLYWFRGCSVDMVYRNYTALCKPCPRCTP
jgi:uncharacterized membrane protein